jgi:protease I
LKEEARGKSAAVCALSKPLAQDVVSVQVDYWHAEICSLAPFDAVSVPQRLAQFLTSIQAVNLTNCQPEIEMPAQLSGRKVAFLATDGVEQVELTAPWNALKGAGADVVLLSDKTGEIQGMNHDEKGQTFPVDREVAGAQAQEFDALVLPGGVANPDKLRTNKDAVRFVREFMEADKPVAAVCHGPWLLVEADAVRGRTVTSWPSLETDIKNAGGAWVDKQVQLDQKLLTSRKPDDLPAFCAQLVGLLTSAIDERRLDKMVEQSFPASDPLPGPIALG